MATNYGTDVLLGARGCAPAFPLTSGPQTVAFNLFRRFTTSEKLPAYKGNSLDLTDVAGDKLDPNTLPSVEKDMIRVAIFEPRVSTIFPKLTLDRNKELLKADVRGVLVDQLHAVLNSPHNLDMKPVQEIAAAVSADLETFRKAAEEEIPVPKSWATETADAKPTKKAKRKTVVAAEDDVNVDYDETLDGESEGDL